MEGGEQRETASKCLHIYNVEANSRIHVYTDRLWTEALRTASVQGVGGGAHSCLLCSLFTNAQLITCAQLTCYIHTGRYVCRPHHMCSLLIARADIISYAHPRIIYTQLLMHAHLVSCAGLTTCAQIVTCAEAPCEAWPWAGGRQSLSRKYHWQTLTSSVLLPWGASLARALPATIVSGRHRSHL